MKWAAWFFFLIWALSTNGQHSVAFLNTLPSAVKATTSAQADRVGRDGAFIPFEVSRGMIIVKARLNDQPGSFIVDTGAPLMVINKAPEATTRQAAKSFAGAIEYTSETINRFQWAEMAFQNLDALALDISHLEASTQRSLSGMVGYNVLHACEVLFDYHHNRMALYDARRNILHRTASPILEIPFELQDHLPVVSVQVGGRTLAFGIDTGAGINLIDRHWLDELPRDLLILRQEEEVRGMDQRMQTVPSALITGMELEGLPLDDQMDFLFTDLQHLQANTNLNIDGLLGFPFLKQLVFSINYPKRKLYIWHIGAAR